MLFYLIIFSLVFFSSLFFFFTSKDKHSYKIKKAKQLKMKLKTFENQGSILNYLRKIDPFVFEELLLESYKKKGYKIVRNKRYTGDGGHDGLILLNNKKYLIQAKRYSGLINPSHISDFSNTIEKFNADGGMFVHTGRTGPTSYKNLQNNIQIVSGSKLIELILT